MTSKVYQYNGTNNNNNGGGIGTRANSVSEFDYVTNVNLYNHTNGIKDVFKNRRNTTEVGGLE